MNVKRYISAAENVHQYGIKLWCIHLVRYYTAIKNGGVLQTYICCSGNRS